MLPTVFAGRSHLHTDAVDAVRGGFLLFPGFELLDATGPIAVLGKIPDKLMLTTFAARSGPVESSQGVQLVAEHSYDDCPPLDLLALLYATTHRE